MKLAFHSPKKASLTILYSVNFENHVIAGPRGFMEISGYPKLTKLPYDKKYKECIKFGLVIINSKLTNQ